MAVDVSVFVELSLVFVIVAIVSILMRIIRQPLIIGYILSGIIASPLALGIVSANSTFETFSHIGIAFLLFLVGLHMNPKFIKDVGSISFVTGLGQVVFTFIGGFFLAKMFGFGNLTSAYISIALTFSSTIIVMKLLSDKNDLGSLYGRISIGFLLVQDLVVVLLLMVISSVQGGGTFYEIVISSLLKGVGLLFLSFVVSHYMLPYLDAFIARSQEFLFIFSLGWCFAWAIMFEFFGFSIEIGALIAGITLSMSPMHYQVTARVKPLRDFFIVLFFVFLGTQMEFTYVGNFIIPIILFSIFVLIGNPLIVMMIMSLMGYSKKNSFLVSTSIAQISEFSFILVALGISAGHLDNDILSIITMVGLITMAGSTYFMMYSDKMYEFMKIPLSIFEKAGRKVDSKSRADHEDYDVILIGYNRTGSDILKPLKRSKKKVLVVDFDPDVVVKLVKEEVDSRYGDVGDLGFLKELNLSSPKMIISTVSDLDANLLLLNTVRGMNKRCIVIVMAQRINDALRLYEEGATYVLLPHFVGGKFVATMIDNHGFNLKSFMKEQFKELGHLHKKNRYKYED
jgi:Kef-type K+ transport system membrane component KefB